MILPRNPKSLIPRKMTEMQRHVIEGSGTIREGSLQEKMLEAFQPVAGGSDPASKRALLKVRFGVSAMANSGTQEELSPPLYHLM